MVSLKWNGCWKYSQNIWIQWILTVFYYDACCALKKAIDWNVYLSIIRLFRVQPCTVPESHCGKWDKQQSFLSHWGFRQYTLLIIYTSSFNWFIRAAHSVVVNSNFSKNDQFYSEHFVKSHFRCREMMAQDSRIVGIQAFMLQSWLEWPQPRIWLSDLNLTPNHSEKVQTLVTHFSW